MKDSYQKIWLFQIKCVPLHHKNNNSYKPFKQIQI